MGRKVLEFGKLQRSLVIATGRMWKQHEWEEDQIRESKKYKFKFLFNDNGPYFNVTDKSTGIEYDVEAYENKWIEGNKIWWSVFTK